MKPMEREKRNPLHRTMPSPLYFTPEWIQPINQQDQNKKSTLLNQLIGDVWRWGKTIGCCAKPTERINPYCPSQNPEDDQERKQTP